MDGSSSRVVLCPGQGAQAVGMGRAWAESSAEARAVFELADKVLGDSLGSPLSELCFAGPVDRLNRTDVSQPAIYTAGIACWRGLIAASGVGAGDGARAMGVVAAAGLSLGEYTALHIAGSFGFEEGLRLVALRGRAMQDAAEAAKGGMVALTGADEAKAQEVCELARGPAGSGSVLVCANFNSSSQIVLSGSLDACERAVGVAESLGLRATPLPVAGAFHSPLMQPAADQLGAALEQTPIVGPTVSVVSNVTARPHVAPGGDTIAAEIRRRLVEQLTSPVRWSQSCEWLASSHPCGAGSGGVSYHEVAPGRTLSGLFRRIDRSIEVQTHDQP